MTPHSGPEREVPWWGRLLRRFTRSGNENLAASLPPVPDSSDGDLRPQLTLGDRAYPPVSLADTCLAPPKPGEPRRALHDASGIRFITDEEVLRVHATHRQWEFRDKQTLPPALDIGGRQEGLYTLRLPVGNVPVYRSVDATAPGAPVRHLIPQQAHRSCTYAAAAMVLLDACSRHGVQCSSTCVLLENIIQGNLGNEEHSLVLMRRAIRGQPLTPQIVRVPFHRTDTLSDLLDRHGPAVGSMGGELGGHSIVIDSVSERNRANPVVRIRDPFHGWDIQTRLSSLTLRGLDLRFLVCSK